MISKVYQLPGDLASTTPETDLKIQARLLRSVRLRWRIPQVAALGAVSAFSCRVISDVHDV
jgi:hypothetical protein